MKKMWIIGLIMLGAFNLAACNTMEGFGEDVESGGEAIQEGANGDSQ